MRILAFFVSTFIFSIFVQANTVHYELIVRNEKVNMSGKKEVDFALTVNGGIPAPTLEFTEGDNAEILVKNEIPNEEVSIHWHGILLPPEEDGVPYVNTPPIHPGKSRLFKFKIRQNGTYWYHSHTAVQEQKGVYGAFIIHPKKKTFQYDKEAVVVLSDWSDENADQIIQNLRKDGDYYLYEKDSVRSYLGALEAGGFKSHLQNEWDRMGGMDLSDVGYDAFLINGKRNSQLLTTHPGEKVRVRIVNASASSYFYVGMGIPMMVVAADGVDIEPVLAKEILMGMAETYDILVTLPEHKNYELRATAQDVTGFATAWLGMADAEKVYSPSKPLPDMYASMDHSAHGGSHAEMDHGTMYHSTGENSMVEHTHKHSADHDMETEVPKAVVDTLTVDSLAARHSTALPKKANIHELKLTLGGDMERYVWHINGKAIHEDAFLKINSGDVVRIVFQNDTMMHHPMHLHGHFFRVLNAQGDRSPLKHTVDVPPHKSRTIEFYANEPGQWMLHCHNLYHMKTGMARIVRYNDFQLTSEMQSNEKKDPHLHEHWYSYAQLEAASNHAKAQLKLMKTWDEVDFKVESASLDGENFSFNKEWETEGDLFYRRWFSNYFNVFGGGSLYHEEGLGVVGVGYVLPLLLETQVSINHEGKLRIDLEKRFQWTKSIFSDADFTWRPEWGGVRDTEFEISLMYGPSWHWSAGFMFTEKSAGVGAQVQF